MTDAWNASRAEVLSVIDRRIEEAKRNIRECQNHGWSVKEIAEYTMVKEELESLKAELKGGANA